MEPASMRFGNFVLDPANRLLLRDGAPVEVSGRYLDALVLLAADAGRLVSKERFMDEVWRGVPVTDEALTQCIRTLRRVLEDDAGRPLFIETVPKHGYRFVAQVAAATGVVEGKTDAPAKATRAFDWRRYGLLGGAGAVGAAMAGLLGGIFYGFVGAAQPLQQAVDMGGGAGGGSIVLVLTALSVLIAFAGGAGVSLGIAAAAMRGGGWPWHVAGGALGGLVVGGMVKLLGVDAFNLLLGRSPGNVTGAIEGAMLGGATGLGVWLSMRKDSIRLWPAALAGAASGMAITALGGRLLGGSLDEMARVFPQSRLRLDQIGMLMGEGDFGLASRIATGALEGTLFVTSVAYTMALANRQMSGGVRVNNHIGYST